MNSCPSCGFFPEKTGGFPSWAPELLREAKGFKAEYFENLVTLELGNFWFEARNKLILWGLEKYFPNFHSFLEVGCGTGFVLSAIAKRFEPSILFGSDVFSEGLAFAAERVPNANLMQMDARRIPYENEFDVVGAFDVIEHIAEDDTVLAQMYRAAKPGGGVILTVPQHPWLWSSTDDYACHERRYCRRELHSKIEAAGFEILRNTSFITLLLPGMILSRVYGRMRSNVDPSREFRIAPSVNRALGSALWLERGMIRLGVSFPLGGSRLIVARKSNVPVTDAA